MGLSVFLVKKKDERKNSLWPNYKKKKSEQKAISDTILKLYRDI